CRVAPFTEGDRSGTARRVAPACRGRRQRRRRDRVEGRSSGRGGRTRADDGPTAASDAGPPLEYTTYTNDKWGFTVEVPTVFSRELKSGPGSRFLWPSKTGSQAEMYAWGAHYVDTPIKSLYEDWIRRPLTFKELQGNAFVV